MVTIRDTVLGFPGLEDAPEAAVTRILMKRNLDGSEIFAPEKDTLVCLAAADLYKLMANSNDFTENKVSVTYSRAQFITTAKMLYRDAGEPESAKALEKKKPLFRGKSK